MFTSNVYLLTQSFFPLPLSLRRSTRAETFCLAKCVYVYCQHTLSYVIILEEILRSSGILTSNLFSIIGISRRICELSISVKENDSNILKHVDHE